MDLALQVEEAQRITAAEGHGAEAETAPLLTVGAHHPALPPSAAEGVEDAASVMSGQRRMIPHLQPQLGQDRPIANLELLLGQLAYL